MEDLAQGRDKIRETLSNGSALSAFERMLVNQNVRPEVAQELCYGDVYKVLPKAKECSPIKAQRSGNGCLVRRILVFEKDFHFNQAT